MSSSKPKSFLSVFPSSEQFEMSDIPISEHTTSDIYNFSCLTCRQRKVRCDKHHPCSNCVRLEKPCNFIPPVRGKRQRKQPKEGLHARLRRFEELLRSYGANIEASNDNEISDDISQQDINMNDDTPHTSDTTESFPHSRLITKDGTSRYFDKYVQFLRKSLYLITELL